MKLNGHSAIITGGGSGLGAETARELARAGARVAVLDLNGAAASAVAGEIEGVGVACDVSDSESMASAIETARNRIGPSRVCVCCAGIGPAARIVGRNGPMPLADFERCIKVNLIGTFNTLRLAAADIIPLEPLDECGERGVIINTASVAAYDGQIGQSAYSASKGGVVGLTLPAARELAQFGIRVLTIAPGIMETPMVAAMPEEVKRSLAASVPFPKRLGRPDEYAKLVLHLIENQMMNGEVIRMDGAIRMPPK